MDVLSIALILLIAWIAIIAVAVALARAAGRADARSDADMRRLSVRADTVRERSDESTPLGAHADEVMRTNTRLGVPQPTSERPAADEPRPAPKRFKRRSRFTTKRARIKNLRD
jgi:hypothetical protein